MRMSRDVYACVFQSINFLNIFICGCLNLKNTEEKSGNLKNYYLKL